MKKYQKEIVKITSKEILLSFLDLSVPFFHASSIYRKSIGEYLFERQCQRSELLERIRHLKKMGFIQTFVEGKEKCIELTLKGINRLKILKIETLKISRPDKWDQKWRLVIFDIPDRFKTNREQLRRKLLSIGFIKIQESVYAYPFDCTAEIDFIAAEFKISDYILIFIADAIRGEEKIIEHFLDLGILEKTDLKSDSKKHIIDDVIKMGRYHAPAYNLPILYYSQKLR